MEGAFKHILVPLDESEAAEVALADAVLLARFLGADVALLEVVQPLGEVIKTGRRDVCPGRGWPERVRRAVSYLLSISARPMWQGIPVRVAVETGEVPETIVHYARSHSMDCIVWPPTPLGETPSRLSPHPREEIHSNGADGHKIVKHYEISKGERIPWTLKDALDSVEKPLTPEIGG